ncbi:MAG: rod shape-determining protein MreD [Cardiobacteriaceae bacterium]|nr:rod shape-determining protein MreD [Cardiobacteriaceae bacterium]
MSVSLVLLLLAWLSMLVAKFFVSWFVLPDMVLMVAVVLFFAQPVQPLWRILLPISLLSDVAAGTYLGYHAAFYVLVLLLCYRLKLLWFEASLLVRTVLLVVMSGVVQVLRCLLLYLLMDIVAPKGWAWGALMQGLLFPFMAEWILWCVHRFGQRVGHTRGHH